MILVILNYFHELFCQTCPVPSGYIEFMEKSCPNSSVKLEFGSRGVTFGKL